MSYYYYDSNRPQLDIKKQHIIISKVNDIWANLQYFNKKRFFYNPDFADGVGWLEVIMKYVIYIKFCIYLQC